MSHCKWLKTSFILERVNTFCDNEKAKQSTIIESLLLVRNLLILILFQTERLYELEWNDLYLIIDEIVKSKQAKNLIDLSCQSMICLLDIIENDDDSKLKFKQLLIEHRLELIKLFCDLIPSPINSFKVISITQIKLILRIYQNNYQFMHKWTIYNLDNKTVEILPHKIILIYEFILKPLKKSKTSFASIMNIYNDQKMWKSIIFLYCNNDNDDDEGQEKEQINLRFSKCCDQLFYFMNQNLLKPKYVKFVSILCQFFIHSGIDLKISADTLFTHILHPAILRFVTKYAQKYKNNEALSQYKKAFDFMKDLKSLTSHEIYGSRIKSILLSSSATNVGKLDDVKEDDNDSKLKTVKFYVKVFWKSNGFIHGNKTKYRNQLLSSERDCVTSIKSIANLLQQFIQNHRKNTKNALKYLDIQWNKEAIQFLVRIVMFKAKSDIFNKSRFENILFTARKLLRILLQSAWNGLESGQNDKILNRKVFISWFIEILQKFQDDEKLSYRSSDSWQISMDSMKQNIAKILKINDKNYLKKEQLLMLCDLVRFISVYSYMDDSSLSVNVLGKLNGNIIDKIEDMDSVAFGEGIMGIVVHCIQSDDMLITCLSKHVFLEFGDLYNSKSFEKLLQFVAPKEETEAAEEEKNGNENIEDDEDVDMDSGMLFVGVFCQIFHVLFFKKCVSFSVILRRT